MKKPVFHLVLAFLILLCFQRISAAQVITPDFESLHNHHGTIMLLIDKETGSIVYVNQAAADFYGYRPEQLLTMKITDLNTLNPEETIREMETAAREERNYFIFKHKLADGELRTVEVYSYPQNIGGKTYLFSIIHDITAKANLENRNRFYFYALIAIVITLLFFLILFLINLKRLKRINQEITNYNELRQTFIDADDSIIYLKDSNLKYIFINKAFEKMHYKKAAQIIGQDDYQITKDEFTRTRGKTDLDVIHNNRLITDEVRWKQRIYKTTKFPVKLGNGTTGIGAYIKDVTDEYKTKKEAEKALKRNLILVDVLTHYFDSAQEQLDYVLNEAVKLTESQFGCLYLYDEEKEEFVLRSHSKDVAEEAYKADCKTVYPLVKTGLLGEVIRKREPVVINDLTQPGGFKKGYPEEYLQPKSFMAVPVIIEGRIVAVIGVANKESDYDAIDVKEISALMYGVWNAKERREAQITLAREREKYLLTLLSIGDAVMVVGKDGTIEMMNKIAENLTGWSGSEATGTHYKEVLVLSHEIQGKTIADPIEGVFKTGIIQELENHAILTSKNGQRFNIEDSAAPIKEDGQTITGVVLVFRDVTEKKQHHKKIEYLSFHDSLTGLYNRRFFEEEMLRLDTPRNLPIALIMGDVNGLKLTNDIFGHTFGDLLLQKVAQTIQSVCRADDIIARWGGDEYVILLPKTSLAEAQQIAQRIKDALCREEIKAIKGSISLGVGIKKEAHENLILALETAENEMYHEKTLARNSTNTTILQDLIRTLHELSPNEMDHAQNVQDLCERIGIALQLTEGELKILTEAAFLHDIGKIAVEVELLAKSGRLDEEELKELRQHPVIGYRILHSFDDTLQLAELVLGHHERWDGRGYPKGLKGEETPKLARIIALVESFDAMIHSTYKMPLTREEAVRELQKHAGTQFDPGLVDVLIRIL